MRESFKSSEKPPSGADKIAVKFTEMQALHWFGMHLMFDQTVAPELWVWGPADLAANEVLNDSLFRPPKRSLFGTPKNDGATLYGTLPRPRSATSWRSPTPRISASAAASAGWLPRYLPDASDDIALMTAKHTWISNQIVADIQFIKELLQVGSPAGSDIRGPGAGRVYFSLTQYLRFHSYVAANIPEFAEDADGRMALYRQWTHGCFAWSEDFARTLAANGDLVEIPESIGKLIVSTFCP